MKICIVNIYDEYSGIKIGERIEYVFTRKQEKELEK